MAADREMIASVPQRVGISDHTSTLTSKRPRTTPIIDYQRNFRAFLRACYGCNRSVRDLCVRWNLLRECRFAISFFGGNVIPKFHGLVVVRTAPAFRYEARQL